MRLKQSSFMALLRKRAADPQTEANFFDDRTRRKWTVRLSVFEINVVKLIELVGL